MKHRVKMLKTVLGVDDGNVIPDTFFEGQEYDIGSDLLAGFVEQGVVELTVPSGVETRESKVTGPEETKPAKPLAKKTRK